MKTQSILKKALLPALLVAVMMLLLLPLLSMPAAAAETSGTCGANGDNLTWTFDSTTATLTISGSGAMKNYGYIDGYGYASAPWSDLGVEIVVIGKGVTSIGSEAFISSESLLEVIIEEESKLARIEGNAFAQCRSLSKVEIPASVQYIGSGAFDYSGPRLYISDLAAWCSVEADSTFSIYSDARLYYNGKLLTDLEIPDGVTVIKDYVFNYSYDYDVKSITIPKSVVSIGKHAFSSVSQSITVDPQNKEYSGAGNCLIEKSTKTLLVGCDNSVIPSDGSVTTIAANAFHCRTIENVYIPACVTAIGEGAFSDTFLDTVIFDPNSTLTRIEKYTFNASELEKIFLPKSIERILSYAFSGVSYVYYGGTAEEWDSILIAADSGLNSGIVQCHIPSLSANVLLGDKFAANGKVTVPAGITATEVGLYVNGVKMQGTLDGGCYLVEGFLKTAAKEIGKTVTVQAYYIANGSEVKGVAIETSIAALLRTYLSNGDEDIVALATATLNYAAAAQVYFGYDVKNLVNEGLAATLPQGEYTDNFAVTEAEPDATVAPYEMALLLNDTVDLHVRIAAKGGAVVDFATLSLAVSENADMSDAITVAFDGKGVAVVKAISPTNWNDTYYFRIVDGEGNAVSATFTYGVSTYYARMSENDDANLSALVDAMMALYEANEAYLAEPYVPEGNQTQPDDISGAF